LVEVGQRNPIPLLTAAAHHETTFRDSEAPGQRFAKAAFTLDFAMGGWAAPTA